MGRLGTVLVVGAMLVMGACQAPAPTSTRPALPESVDSIPGDHGPAADAEAAEIEVPLDVVPPYVVIRTERANLPTRIRYRTDILVQRTYDRDELITVLVDAATQTLRARRDAAAAVVFAFTNPRTVGRVYDTGRALVSRDGLGWKGDGSFVPFLAIADEGKIYLTLGSALSGLEHIVVRKDSSEKPATGPGRELELGPTLGTPPTLRASMTVISSVWLREQPSTMARALRLLLPGTPVDILEGTATTNGLHWAPVRTEDGTVGWAVSSEMG